VRKYQKLVSHSLMLEGGPEATTGQVQDGSGYHALFMRADSKLQSCPIGAATMAATIAGSGAWHGHDRQDVVMQSHMGVVVLQPAAGVKVAGLEASRNLAQLSPRRGRAKLEPAFFGNGVDRQ